MLVTPGRAAVQPSLLSRRKVLLLLHADTTSLKVKPFLCVEWELTWANFSYTLSFFNVSNFLEVLFLALDSLFKLRKHWGQTELGSNWEVFLHVLSMSMYKHIICFANGRVVCGAQMPFMCWGCGDVVTWGCKAEEASPCYICVMKRDCLCVEVRLFSKLIGGVLWIS